MLSSILPYTIARILELGHIIQAASQEVGERVILNMNFSINRELVDPCQCSDPPKRPQGNHKQTKYLNDHEREK